MILTGPEIISAVHRGDIEIDPFEPGNVNPASIDLRLGSKAACYKRWVFSGSDGARPSLHGPDGIIDVKKKGHFETAKFEFDDETGLILRPGVLYLMHTVEQVHAKNLVPVLDGKSSIGRLGIVIHLTAGFGDPGFDGQYTLEVTAMHPIRIYAGMRFCQMRFHKTAGSIMSYQKTGRYVGEAAKGPVPSKVYEQFKEK